MRGYSGHALRVAKYAFALGGVRRWVARMAAAETVAEQGRIWDAHLRPVLLAPWIARLFLAGVVPGLMLAAMFSAYVMIWALMNKDRMPPKEPSTTWAEKGRALSLLLPTVLLIVAVIGSIYAGLASPTEAAVVGVVGHEPGHCAPRTCLHLGVRRGENYVDPLSLLGRRRVVLLPLGG